MPDEAVGPRLDEAGPIARPRERREGLAELDDAAHGEQRSRDHEQPGHDRRHGPRLPGPGAADPEPGGRDQDEQDPLDEDPALAPRPERGQAAHGASSDLLARPPFAGEDRHPVDVGEAAVAEDRVPLRPLVDEPDSLVDRAARAG